MRVKIEVLKDEGDADNSSVNVETHFRRGDMFNVHKSDTIVSGENQTIVMAPGGRLVINSPLATEKPVYDRDQGAAVYASQQGQGREGADRANPDDIVKQREADLAQAKDEAERQKEIDRRQQEAAEASVRTPPQGGQPLNKGPVDVTKPQPGSPPNTQFGMTAQGDAVKTTTTPSTTPAHGGTPAPQGGNMGKK